MKKNTNSRTVSSFEEARIQALSAAKKEAKSMLLRMFDSVNDFKFICLFRQDTFSFKYRWEFCGEHGEDISYVRILIDDLVTDSIFKSSLEIAYDECKKLGEQRSTKGNKISTQKEQEALPTFRKALQNAFAFISTNESIFNVNIALAERIYQLVWKATKEDGNVIKGFKSFVKATQAQLIKMQYDRDVKRGFYEENGKSGTPITLLLPENIQPVIVNEEETEDSETVDYSTYTVKELKNILTEKNISFEKNAKKADLIQLLAA